MSGQPAGWRRPDGRWLLLAPAGAVPVPVTDRWRAVQRLAGLPSGTPVALVGRRGLRGVAWQAEVVPGPGYLVLPAADRPVAVAAPGPGLAWVARTVLTVPSGRHRGQLAATLAVRAARHAPWLLRAAGQRLLLGRRG
ncbi:MAG TPA: hypothetical protein VMB79_13325 [Jatrophihabitans sp.]|nr:hypothetical protein [Jatrophihabitans sp.]